MQKTNTQLIIEAIPPEITVQLSFVNPSQRYHIINQSFCQCSPIQLLKNQILWKRTDYVYQENKKKLLLLFFFCMKVLALLKK